MLKRLKAFLSLSIFFIIFNISNTSSIRLTVRYLQGFIDRFD